MLNTDADLGCIINNPQWTMAHPILDFDVDKAAERVLEEAALSPDSKSKAVIAVARGIGGGKTRSMEEIRRNLLRRQNVLPVGVTFNCETPLGDDSWLNGVGAKVAKKYYALSVTTRMISSVFGIPYADLVEIVENNLPSLNLSGDSAKFLREATTFLVNRVNRGRALLLRPTEPIKTFVLLLDESRHIDSHLNSADLGAVARKALLDKRVAPGLDASLVISDLGFLPNNLRSLSDREVSILTLPARLSCERVVREWWCLPLNLTEERRSALTLVAASFNNMPRALEVACKFLHDPENIKRPVDKFYLHDMYKYLFAMTKKKYHPVVPPTRVLSAMFFREAILLDDDLMTACMRSVATNPLEEFDFLSTSIPDASLLLLRLARPSSETMAGPLLVIHQGIDAVIDTLIEGSDQKRKVGDVLEVAMLQALRARLALAAEERHEQKLVAARETTPMMTLGRLCGLVEKSVLYTNIDTFTALTTPLDVLGTASISGSAAMAMKASSRSKGGARVFLDELNGVEVSTSCPVRIMRSAPGDAWDVGLKAHNAATGLPFYVFFECKSGAEFVAAQSNNKVVAMLKKAKQYLHMKKVLGTTHSFLFVYCSSHEGLETRPLPPTDADSASLPSRAVVLNRLDTLNFLGPFSEIYRVARSAFGQDLAE